MTNRKRNALVILCIFIVLIFTISLLITPQITKEITNNKPDKYVTMIYDYPVTSELNQMIETADYVVIGEYGEFIGKWNSSRDNFDINKESSEFYTEGWKYKFKISEVLKGNIADDEIIVNHTYARKHTYVESNAIINEIGEIVEPATEYETITVNNPNPLFIEPEKEQTYILFLCHEDFFDTYYGAIEPFILKIENEKVILMSNLIDRTDRFELTEIASNGDIVQFNVNMEMINDTITGLTVAELKDIIK